AFRAFHADGPVRDLDLDVRREGHGLFADAGHGGKTSSGFRYHTVHSSSPPRRLARAWRSLMTPLLVLTIAMPKPSSTGLSWSWRRYRRRPGRLARSRRRMTFSPSGPYFKKMRKIAFGPAMPALVWKTDWPWSLAAISPTW